MNVGWIRKRSSLVRGGHVRPFRRRAVALEDRLQLRLYAFGEHPSQRRGSRSPTDLGIKPNSDLRPTVGRVDSPCAAEGKSTRWWSSSDTTGICGARSGDGEHLTWIRHQSPTADAGTQGSYRRPSAFLAAHPA